MGAVEVEKTLVRDTRGQFFVEQEFYDTAEQPGKSNPCRRVRWLSLLGAVRALIRCATHDERFQREAMALLPKTTEGAR